MDFQIRVDPRLSVEKKLRLLFPRSWLHGETVQRFRVNITVISVSTSTGLSFK